jgi:uncharacterized protein (TIGR02996 family)
MNAAEPFLRAIHDRPDDDAPRLVYADWLDDRGDAARAGFIRVQCALARAAANDPRRPAWQARERELLERHHTEWGGLMHELFSNLDFRRGFLYCTGFHQPPRPIGDEGVLRLLEDCQVAGMTLMTLDDCEVSDRGVEALAASWQVQDLQDLLLGGNRVGPVGAAALARSQQLKRLRCLDLFYNRLGDAGVASLLAAPPFRLRRLDLSGNGISDEGARMLADAAVLAELQSLPLFDNLITPAGFAAMRASPHVGRCIFRFDGPPGVAAEEPRPTSTNATYDTPGRLPPRYGEMNS